MRLHFAHCTAPHLPLLVPGENDYRQPFTSLTLTVRPQLRACVLRLRAGGTGRRLLQVQPFFLTVSPSPRLEARPSADLAHRGTVVAAHWRNKLTGETTMLPVQV